MAIRGYEVRLMLSMQNQASSAIRRAGADLRALNAESTLGLQQERQAIGLARSRATQESIAIQMDRVGLRQDRMREQIRMNTTGSKKLRHDLTAMRLEQARRMGLTKSEERMSRAISGRELAEYRVAKSLADQLKFYAKIENIEGELPLHMQAQEVAIAQQVKAAQAGLVTADAHMRTTEKMAALDNKSMARAQEAAAAERILQQQRWETHRATVAIGKELGLSEKQAGLLADRLGISRREAEKMVAEIAHTEKMIQQLPGQRLQTKGRTVAHMGRVAGIAGLVGTAAAGAAAESAATFDTGIVQAATQARDITGSYDQIGEKADEIRKKVIDMMQAFPASSDEMTASAYDIFSSINLMRGGVTDMALGFKDMEAANKVAVAGNEDLATATSTLVTVINNFDPKQQHLNETLDTTFDIIRFGRMRLRDFDQMMNKIAPAASGAGQSLEDVGGAMAFLTEVMPSQQRASTGLARLLDAFQHPDFVRGMKELDANIVDSTGHLKPFDKVMQTIVGRFPELEKGGTAAQNFFRTVTQAGRLARSGRPGQGIIFTQEGRRALTQIVGHMDEFLERQKQIEDNTGEFDTEYRRMLATQGVQWKIFMGQVRAIVLVLGREAIPVFVAIGRQLSKLIDWFQNLSPNTQHWIGLLIAATPVVLLLGGALASLVGSFLALAGWLKIIKPDIKLVALSLKTLAKLGAITIAIKLLRGGDLQAWDLLALAGLLAGAAIGGIPGAAVATIPIALKLMDSKKGNPLSRESREDYFSKLDAGIIENAEKNGRNWRGMFARTFKSPLEITARIDLALRGRSARDYREARAVMEKSIMPEGGTDRLRDLFRYRLITAKAYTRTLRAVGESVQSMGDAHDRAGKSVGKLDEAEKGIVGTLREAAKNAKTDVERSELQALADQMDAINKSFHQGNDELSKWRQNLKRTLNSARKDAENQLTQAAQNLTSIYEGFRQTNQQQFGQMFEGPWLNSEFGQTAEEWGITPGIGDLTKDLQMQVDNFRNFRTDIAAISQRGAPEGLIAELQALGPDALDQLEVLRKAAPAKFKAFVDVWNQKDKAITDATKIDFDAKLKQWYSYGSGIARNIILGLQSENVALDNAFRTYITNKFPNLVQQLTDKAVEEWKGENPKPAAPPNLSLSGTKTGGNTTNNHTTTNIHVHPQPGEDTATVIRKAAFIWKNGGRSSAGGRTGR